MILGIVYALKALNRSYRRHQRSKIENLQLHLNILKLNLDTNKLKIEKSVLLQDQFRSIISTIESATREIEAEINEKQKP